VSQDHWVDIGPPGSLRFDSGAAVQIQGRELAVFRDGGEYRAVENVCPHQGAPLAFGWAREGVVTCPWHAWEFNIRSGECVTSGDPKHRVAVYPVREREGRLEVEIPGTDYSPGRSPGE
jgi:nitrite reductase/ring-hydroxylating ferredoxin subunit